MSNRCEPPPAYDKIYEVEPSSVEPLNPPRYPAFLHSQRNTVRQTDRAPLILSLIQSSDLNSNCTPKKEPLKYERLAKAYILFLTSICWTGILFGFTMAWCHTGSWLMLCGCSLVPFPFLFHGYRGIEERNHKLMTPLVVFLIVSFILIIVPLSVGCVYFAISNYIRRLEHRNIIAISTVFILFVLIPSTIHAIGTMAYVRRQISRSVA